MVNESLNFVIEGGKTLSGTIQTNSSKNSAVALLCASLLNKSQTILRNMPRIEEVNRILEVLNSIDVKTEWLNDKDLQITPPTEIKLDQIDAAAAMRTRTVIMFLGPLIHLFKDFSIPQPGGCKLGERTVRPHLYALEKLGVQITAETNNYSVKVGQLQPAEIIMYESGDTTTENAIMAASKIPGQTVIKYASANYQVQDLCYFLTQFGVKIEGIGTSTLTITGVEEINQPIEYSPIEDPIEAMFFLAAAIVTKSEITITRAPIAFLELELLKLEKMGFKYKLSPKYKSVNGHTDLVDITTYPSQLTALEEKIHPNVYPGLNMDNLPFFVPIATQAEGTTLIHDWVYEDRAIYYLDLNKLNANIKLADIHRINITGPSHLRGAEMVCPPALRPAAIILIAMLAAEGKSILRNVYSINRGYENLYERLAQLGADIKTLD